MQNEYVNGDAMIREEIEKLERWIEDAKVGGPVVGDLEDGPKVDRAKYIASLEARIADLRRQLS
ncbi:hypothetical protein [Terricaulis sp.]|uniref:hypothetical protein n=1 Tax=Terricaulis sp. TaxID=2768686 RepID=UPI00378400FC